MGTANKSQFPGVFILALFLLSLILAIWSVGGVLELILRMGHGTGMYSDYGKSTGETILASIFLAINSAWLLFDTFIAIRVFKRNLGLRWLGAAVVFSIILFVATGVYLLGVGHS